MKCNVSPSWSILQCFNVHVISAVYVFGSYMCPVYLGKLLVHMPKIKEYPLFGRSTIEE